MATNAKSIINKTNEDIKSSFTMLPKGISISGSVKRYNNYVEMVSDKNPPDYAYVIDATADQTVKVGGAFYLHTDTGWKKMYEEESMDQDVSLELVTDKVGTYLIPEWIRVFNTEGLAQFDIDTTRGVYYSIRITDAMVEEYGKVFDINFLSTVAGARYSNTIPMSEDKAFIFVDVAVDSPSKDVKIRVDGALYSTPNKLDIYWNGDRAVLDPKVKQIVKLQSEVAALKEQINIIKTETANIETVFVNDGTDEHPAEVTLVDDEWCVMTSPFVATLPANAKNGDSIHMSIEHGSANMVVLAPEGTTINGQAKPCLVGVDEDGFPISNISFYFVYNEAQSNWIVL